MKQKILSKEEKILKLISRLVESDAGFESDSVYLDILDKKPVSERERILAELVGKIYKIVHPLFSGCRHENWAEETEKLLNKIE